MSAFLILRPCYLILGVRGSPHLFAFSISCKGERLPIMAGVFDPYLYQSISCGLVVFLSLRPQAASCGSIWISSLGVAFWFSKYQSSYLITDLPAYVHSCTQYAENVLVVTVASSMQGEWIIGNIYIEDSYLNCLPSYLYFRPHRRMQVLQSSLTFRKQTTMKLQIIKRSTMKRLKMKGRRRSTVRRSTAKRSTVKKGTTRRASRTRKRLLTRNR